MEGYLKFFHIYYQSKTFDYTITEKRVKGFTLEEMLVTLTLLNIKIILILIHGF